MSDPNPESLPRPLRLPLLWLALGCTLAAVLLGVYYAGTSTAGALDVGVRAAFQKWFPDATAAALAVDWWGGPAGVILLSGVLGIACLLTGQRRLAVVALTCQGLVGATTSLLKPVFERTIHGPFLAYPSGHTAGATALAMVLGLLLARLGRTGPGAGLLLVIGVTVAAGATAAWAQIILAAHYPTDTLGGFLTAVALIPPAAMLTDLAADRLARRAARTG